MSKYLNGYTYEYFFLLRRHDCISIDTFNLTYCPQLRQTSQRNWQQFTMIALCV